MSAYDTSHGRRRMSERGFGRWVALVEEYGEKVGPSEVVLTNRAIDAAVDEISERLSSDDLSMARAHDLRRLRENICKKRGAKIVRTDDGALVTCMWLRVHPRRSFRSRRRYRR